LALFVHSRFILLASAGWRLDWFSGQQSDYSGFGSKSRFWVGVLLLAFVQGQIGPTSHAPDASPRSVSRLFFTLSVFPLSATGPRGKAPVMHTVSPPLFIRSCVVLLKIY
jgi:hypothetical protein